MVRETGKRRGSRIELDYYRGSDQLERWRGRFCLLVIAAIAAWLGAEALASRDQATGARLREPAHLASKGPLSQAHAMWDSSCQACHLPFTPINHSRWAPALKEAKAARGSDERCRTCHAAPAHHQNERVDDVPACAECHRDHRGREVSLLAMDDSMCTRCHGDLSRHGLAGGRAPSVEAVVTRFDTGNHPDFKTTPIDRAKSPRRVKFSHARHLAAGLTPEQGGSPFTFAQLAPLDRARYGFEAGQELDRPVQLKCDACHSLDAGEAGSRSGRADSGLRALRSSGAYMLPVAYDRHCAACHPLAFDAQSPEQQVRHGVPPAEVVRELQRYYAAKAALSDPAFLHEFVPPRPFPGRATGPAEQRFEAAIEANVASALRLLLSHDIDPASQRRQAVSQGRRGCVECHNLKPHEGPLVRSRDFALLEIEPVLMTPVWFQRAFFDHAAHRALECAACHAAVSSSKENGDRPLLPAIAVCAACHAAEGGGRFGEPASASARCTECHRYHDGDHPERGRGAAAWRGKTELSAQQFQSGGESGQGR